MKTNGFVEHYEQLTARVMEDWQCVDTNCDAIGEGAPL